MATLHESVDLNWGQFDDAPEDATIGIDIVSCGVDASAEVMFTDATTELPVKEFTHYFQLSNKKANCETNHPRKQNVVTTEVALKSKVTFAPDVKELNEKKPHHVLPTYHNPMELRGSSRRANPSGKISTMKRSQRTKRLSKEKPNPIVLTSPSPASKNWNTNNIASTQPVRLAATTANNETRLPTGNHNELGELQRRNMNAPSAAMPESSKVTTHVTAPSMRVREMETAELLRSLRQTNNNNKRLQQASIGPSTDNQANKKQRLSDEVEEIGVFPRPSRPSQLQQSHGCLKPGTMESFRRLSMSSGTFYEEGLKKVVPTSLPEVKKTPCCVNRTSGDSRLMPQPLQKPAPCQPKPNSVTPPLSSVPGMWEGPMRGEPDLLLGSQKQQRSHPQHFNFGVPVPKRMVAIPGYHPPGVAMDRRVMGPPRMSVPMFQAPPGAVYAKRPTLLQPHRVVCFLPPHLLPPPMLPSMRAKTAVEGFVAPLNVPTVPEDKGRKYPIPNTSLRKRDVLFFAPLVRCKIQHHGTLQYCFYCFKYQKLYTNCNPSEKRELLNNLIRYVRVHGGRFLEWDEKLKSWFEIGDVRAAQRTTLGLSGDAPQSRKES